jgi:hypothetical protein
MTEPGHDRVTTLAHELSEVAQTVALVQQGLTSLAETVKRDGTATVDAIRGIMAEIKSVRDEVKSVASSTGPTWSGLGKGATIIATYTVILCSAIGLYVDSVATKTLYAEGEKRITEMKEAHAKDLAQTEDMIRIKTTLGIALNSSLPRQQ